jgi:hypothetical protein
MRGVFVCCLMLLGAGCPFYVTVPDLTSGNAADGEPGDFDDAEAGVWRDDAP